MEVSKVSQEIVLSDGTHKKTLLQKVASTALATVMLCNANIFTVAAFITFGPMWIDDAFAQEADDELLERLRTKHDLSNPYRQFQSTDVEEGQFGQPVNRNITDKLEQMLNNRSDKQLDLERYMPEEGVAEESIQGYRTQAQSIGFGQKLPTSTNTGQTNYNVSYNKESKLEVYRNPETGKLEVRTKENADEIETVDASVASDEIFSAQTNHHQTSFEGKETYGDEDALFQVGRDTHGKLKSAGTKTGESISYKTVTGFARKGINTEVPEQILQPGFSAVEHANSNESDFFSSCSTTTTTEQGSLYRPEEVIETCSQPAADNMFYCELEREFRVPVVIEAEGVRSCGPGCYAIVFDERYKAGTHCDLREMSRSFMLNLAPGMELESVKVAGLLNDHMRLTVNNTTMYSRVWNKDGVDLALPPTGAGAPKCDALGGGAWQTINRDISGQFDTMFQERKSVVDDTEQMFVELDFQAAIRHEGGYDIEVQFQFNDLSGLGFGDIIHQKPAGCFDRVSPQVKNNGGWDGLRAMGFNEDTFPASQCRFNSYEMLEEGARGFPDEFLDLMIPLHPGDEGWVNWHTNLKGYTCDPFNGGEYCVVGADGQEQCYYWDDIRNQENQCQVHEEDERCSETARECVEGWTDEETGICYLEEVEFTCDYGNDVAYEYTTTSSSCDGMIPCSGGDCSFGEDERNENFNQAMVMGNVMEHMKSDSSCEDPTDPSTCRIFEGEYEYCGWEVSGVSGVNCCEKPEGVSFLEYFKMSQMMLKFGNMATDGLFETTANGITQGAWETISQPIGSAATAVWDSLYEPFTSAVETAVGNITGLVTDEAGRKFAENFGGGIMGAVQQQISQFIYDLFPELGKLLFSTTTNAGGQVVVNGMSEGMTQFTNFLGNVMMVYMAYQIIKLALTMIAACDENEQDVGLKIEMRQCFMIRDKYCHKSAPWGGCLIRRRDHCCYSSMLSRIIMEQAAPMLNKDMTQCDGLTPDELSQLDFSQIDLSEWIATLYEADMVPDGSEEELTGEGRMTNSFSRDTASERTQDRTENVDENIDAFRNILKQPNIDCSVHPRPPSCEFGFNPEDDGGL